MLMKRNELQELTSFIARAIDAAKAVETPFYHLELDHIFPEDVYSRMLACMPVTQDYRPMAGRGKSHIQDGVATRVKIDLFPEYIRALPGEKRELWSLVGRALCSAEVRDAFVRRMAPTLRQRFGEDYQRTGLYPIPILTRDIPGYSLGVHADTPWKGITIQLYLPPDDSISHVGTVFNRRLPDGTFVRDSQMRFARNTGYAFTVAPDSWHSVDLVPEGIKCRDSILLTYFVDSGALRLFRNRYRRVGNFLLNELRNLVRR